MTKEEAMGSSGNFGRHSWLRRRRQAQAMQLIRVGYLAEATAYLLASTVAGLVAVWIGMISARIVVRVEQWIQQEI
jgi:hypothetical protein